MPWGAAWKGGLPGASFVEVLRYLGGLIAAADPVLVAFVGPLEVNGLERSISPRGPLYIRSDMLPSAPHALPEGEEHPAGLVGRSGTGASPDLFLDERPVARVGRRAYAHGKRFGQRGRGSQWKREAGPAGLLWASNPPQRRP
jgi:hypothetical protein